MDVVGVCNLALGWLGAKPITSLDDAQATAALCKANFVENRNAVTEAKAWTFALTRLALAPDTTAPAFGYSTRHLVPATVLSVMACDDGGDTWDLDWVKEGRYILSDNAGTLYLKGIAVAEDPATWPPGFTQAVAYRLAAILAVPITENRALQADYWQLYEKALQEAGAREGRQGRAEHVVRGSNLSARRY